MNRSKRDQFVFTAELLRRHFPSFEPLPEAWVNLACRDLLPAMREPPRGYVEVLAASAMVLLAQARYRLEGIHGADMLADFARGLRSAAGKHAAKYRRGPRKSKFDTEHSGWKEAARTKLKRPHKASDKAVVTAIIRNTNARADRRTVNAWWGKNGRAIREGLIDPGTRLHERLRPRNCV